MVNLASGILVMAIFSCWLNNLFNELELRNEGYTYEEFLLI